MNIPTLSDSLTRENLHVEMLKVTARSTPDMTVKVSAGQFWVNDSFYEFPGGNSATLTSASANPKIAVIGIKPAGISIIYGAEAANPVLPSLDSTFIPIAAVVIRPSDTFITDDMIFDVRPFVSGLYTAFPHNNLTNRDVTDAHPISAITDLQTTLDDKAEITSLTAGLSGKADTLGTGELTFKLNKDHSGSPTENCSFLVERGAEDDKAITWKESTDQWLVDEDFEVFSSLPATDLKGLILMDSAGARYRLTVTSGGGSITITAI